MKHTFTLRHWLLTGLLALALPGTALALVPPSVTGITAQGIGDQIQVQWKAVNSTDIAYYRVYYSTESILQNDGLYDDFERTTGPETSLTFARPNSSLVMYVAVIAVNTAGEESEFFTHEAAANFGGSSSVPTVPISSASSAPFVPSVQSVSSVAAPVSNSSARSVPEYTPGANLELLSAESLSATGVLTTFSAPVTVEAEKAPSALNILDPNGNTLAITRITITGQEMMIYTKPQTNGVVYRVSVTEPFMGIGGEVLDPVNRSALFTGHQTGVAGDSTSSTPSTTRVVNPQSPPDVENFAFTPALLSNGLYSLVAEWQIDNTPKDLAYFLVYQTRDRGQSFSGPSILPVDIRGVQLDGVTPGEYGMVVQTLNVYGYLSRGVFQNVYLPDPRLPRNPLQGNLTQGGAQDITFPVTEPTITPLAANIEQGDETLEPAPEGNTFTTETPVRPKQRVTAARKYEIVLVLAVIGIVLVIGSMFFFKKK